MRSTEAGLDTKVSPTLLAYYALWGDSTQDTSHEVASYLGRGEKRAALLGAFADTSVRRNRLPLSSTSATPSKSSGSGK